MQENYKTLFMLLLKNINSSNTFEGIKEILQEVTYVLDEETLKIEGKIMPWHWKNRAEDSLPLYVDFKKTEDIHKKEFSEMLAQLKGLGIDELSSEIALFEAALTRHLAVMASLAAQLDSKITNVGPFRVLTEKELWNDRCKAYQYIM